MDPARLIAGYQRIMRTIYSPAEYYQRALDSMKRTQRSAPEPEQYELLSSLVTLLRIGIRLGVLDRERREFWRFLGQTARSHRLKLAESLRLAAMGYHFRKLAEVYGAN